MRTLTLPRPHFGCPPKPSATARKGVAIAAVLAVSSLALAGCEGKGAGITQRIQAADSPLVAEVVYAPPNVAGRIEHLYIFLIADVTDSQIVEAWCQVIVPAGVDQLPENRVSLQRAGTADPSDLNFGAVELPKPACPQGASPGAS